MSAPDSTTLREPRLVQLAGAAGTEGSEAPATSASPPPSLPTTPTLPSIGAATVEASVEGAHELAPSDDRRDSEEVQAVLMADPAVSSSATGLFAPSPEPSPDVTQYDAIPESNDASGEATEQQHPTVEAPVSEVREQQDDASSSHQDVAAVAAADDDQEREMSVASDFPDPDTPSDVKKEQSENSALTREASAALQVAATPPPPLKFPLPAKPTTHSSPRPTSRFDSAGPVASAKAAPHGPKPVLTKLAQLKQRVAKDPTDGEAWLELLADAEKKGDLERTREVYTGFLEHFPDAAPQWIAYATLELNHGHFHEVELIFSDCLRKSISVDLWAFYLNYIRRVNPIEGEKAAASRATIAQAYEFSLNHIGNDRESGPIWQDYIGLLKAGEVTITWQEQQKMDSLRKVYQRAVCVPLNNVEQIWREYDQFENSVSKMTAKKFLGERSPQYMTARSALREMKNLTDNLHRPLVPTRPSWKSPSDKHRLEGWKAYLKWEEGNPLELEDPAALQARVQYAYKQAIMHMRFFPEVWFLSAMNLLSHEKSDECLELLQAGLAANKSSIMLTFAVAEQHEARRNIAECYKVYDALIAYRNADIEAANKEMEDELARVSFESADAAVKANGGASGDVDMDPEVSEEEQRRVKEEEVKKAAVVARCKPRIDELQEDLASVWINELRFARRAESIKAGRAVFKRFRDSACKTGSVFVAVAKMEYYWNKSADVARKTFGLGLKMFGEDPDYVLQYLDFLIALNDDSNARALFEKTMTKIPAEAARPIWQRWASYEYWNGDKAAGDKFNSRLAEAFPDSNAVDRFVDQHSYAGLKSVLERELGSGSPDMPPEAPAPPVRVPSPVPSHLQGFGFKAVGSTENMTAVPPTINIPSRPKKVRERSWSPEGRSNTRVRGNNREPTPDRRDGPAGAGAGAGATGGAGGRVRRSRFDSPPPTQQVAPPPAVPRHDPYAWFPEALKFFISILPSAGDFEAQGGPRLDAATVVQVLKEANFQAGPPPAAAPPPLPAAPGWAGMRRGGRR